MDMKKPHNGTASKWGYMKEPIDSNPLSRAIYDAMQCTLAGEGKLSERVRTMPGMSGQKFRVFLNTLIGSLGDARYLEVGVWKGSTLCAAIEDNPHAVASGIDNWSQFGGPQDEALRNLGRNLGLTERGHIARIINADYRTVNYDKLGRFNVYFYDGPHIMLDQKNGIVLPWPALDEQFILIVDDWNWPRVRHGTLQGIAAAGYEIDYYLETRTVPHEFDFNAPPTDWHNGYFIASCHKKTAVRPVAPVPPLPCVAFGIPTVSKWVSMDAHTAMLKLQWRMFTEGISLTHIVVGGDLYLSKVRNRIATTFLKDYPDATDLFFLDDDVGFPDDAAIRLIRSDKDIIAGIYPKKNDGDPVWPAEMLAENGELIREGPLVKAAFLPTGFMRIKRHVLEQMAMESYTYKDTDSNGEEIEVYNIFEMGYSVSDGKWWGEDYAFCRRWREMGGDLWVDPDIQFTHRGTKAWEGNFINAVNSYGADAAKSREPDEPIAEAAE